MIINTRKIKKGKELTVNYEAYDYKYKKVTNVTNF